MLKRLVWNVQYEATRLLQASVYARFEHLPDSERDVAGVGSTWIHRSEKSLARHV